MSVTLLQLLNEMQSKTSLRKGQVISGFCYVSDQGKGKTIDVVVRFMLRKDNILIWRIGLARE